MTDERRFRGVQKEGHKAAHMGTEIMFCGKKIPKKLVDVTGISFNGVTGVRVREHAIANLRYDMLVDGRILFNI
jgi:hypothetical protein